MSRQAGRFSALYVAVTSAGQATPVAFAGSWDLDLSTPNIDVTALGDTSQVFVAGLPTGSTTFDGFADNTAGTSLVTAAIDGQARKWYSYPFSDRTQYAFGTAFVAARLGTSASGAVTIGGTLTPATSTQTAGF